MNATNPNNPKPANDQDDIDLLSTLRITKTTARPVEAKRPHEPMVQLGISVVNRPAEREMVAGAAG